MRPASWVDCHLALLLLFAAVSPLAVTGAERRSTPLPTDGIVLQVAGSHPTGALTPTPAPTTGEVSRLRVSSALGKPKIAYSFNADDDLAAIRRAGFTHVLVSYLPTPVSDDLRHRFPMS